MKAVIKFLGKQYLVSEGKEIITEKVKEKEPSKVQANEVLLIIDNSKVKIGNPFIKNAKVQMEVIETKKDKKIKIIKFKAKKRYKRHKGHRQIKSRLKIKKIEVK